MAKGWIVAVTLLGAGLVQCRDETVSGYLQGEAVFELTEMAGEPAPSSVTIDLSESGQVAGQGPCNRYSALQTAPYPWFELGPIQATRAACPALREEQRYFELLAKMTLAEISGPVLILSVPGGESLVFRARP